MPGPASLWDGTGGDNSSKFKVKKAAEVNVMYNPISLGGLYIGSDSMEDIKRNEFEVLLFPVAWAVVKKENNFCFENFPLNKTRQRI